MSRVLLRGWGLHNPQPAHLSLVLIGRGRGCTRADCAHQGHAAFAPTRGLLARPGGTIEGLGVPRTPIWGRIEEWFCLSTPEAVWYLCVQHFLARWSVVRVASGPPRAPLMPSLTGYGADDEER